MVPLLLALLAAADSSADNTVVRDIQVAPQEVLRTTMLGAGEPVVFIPGLFGSAFGYRRLTGPMAERGYRSIVVEPLGYGWSSHPSHADYSFAAQADRVAQALDSLGVSQALLVAQSTGTSIALRLAIRRPDLVRGLVSIDGGPVESPATPGLRRSLRLGGVLTKLVLTREAFEHGVRKAITENSGDTSWITDSVVAAYAAGPMADLHGTIDAFRAMSKAKEPTSLFSELHQCVVPVRLLRGSVSHPNGVTASEIEMMSERLPDFAVDSVPASGQYVHEEQPDVVLAVLLKLDEETD